MSTKGKRTNGAGIWNSVSVLGNKTSELVGKHTIFGHAASAAAAMVVWFKTNQPWSTIALCVACSLGGAALALWMLHSKALWRKVAAERAVHECVRRVAYATGAAVELALPSENPTTLYIPSSAFVSERPPEVLTQRFAVPRHKDDRQGTLAGHAYASGRPVVANNARRSWKFRRLGKHDEQTGSALSIPFTAASGRKENGRAAQRFTIVVTLFVDRPRYFTAHHQAAVQALLPMLSGSVTEYLALA